jgi:hypothetical protein
VNEPQAWMQTFTQSYKGVTEVKHAVNIERIGINDIPLYFLPENTYEDGIRECVDRAEAYAYLSPNFLALADELRSMLRNNNIMSNKDSK